MLCRPVHEADGDDPSSGTGLQVNFVALPSVRSPARLVFRRFAHLKTHLRV